MGRARRRPRACPRPGGAPRLLGRDEGETRVTLTRVTMLSLVTAIALSAAWPVVAAAAVAFDATPPADTNQTSAAFQFHNSGGPASFDCKLDAGSFSSCASPVNLLSLSEGQHSFSVWVATGATPPPPTTYT